MSGMGGAGCDALGLATACVAARVDSGTCGMVRRGDMGGMSDADVLMGYDGGGMEFVVAHISCSTHRGLGMFDLGDCAQLLFGTNRCALHRGQLLRFERRFMALLRSLKFESAFTDEGEGVGALFSFAEAFTLSVGRSSG